MIRRFVEGTLNNGVFVNLLFFLFMVVGFYALFSLPMERYPNVQMGKVIISTFYPGASPQDVELLVTRKIEDALEDVENIEYVQSKSYGERSSVMVKFIDDVDYEKGYDDIRFRVLGMLNELPDTVDPPTFTKIEVATWLPAAKVNLIGERSNRALSLMAEEMKLPLRRIPGVKEVNLQGEHTREFHIYLDPDKLLAHGVTFEEVVRALKLANFSIPAGDFVGRGEEYVVRVDEQFRSQDQVATTIVRKDLDGSFVTVADVMDTVRMDYRDPSVINSVNGKPCVSLNVVKNPEGNVLDIVPAVEAVVAEYESALALEGVDVILTQDQRVQVEDGLNTLLSNMLVGISLVCIVLWLFLGLRNAALTSVGIPFAFLVTMVIMYASGNSLNEITLFSFVLVSGIIVDDAIVVVENIHRHVQLGRPLRQAVVEGTSEVFVPVIAATSTTAAAFLPMLIMSGSTGEFFAEVPKAVTAAIAASLIECLVILPAHFFDWPGRSRLKSGHGEGEGRDERIMKPIRDFAARLVKLCLRYRFPSIGAVLLAFFAALAILVVSITGVAPLIKIKFFPDEYNLFFIELKGPTGTPIEEMDRRLREISRFVTDMGPGMAKSASASAGFYMNEDYETIFGRNTGNIVVEMPDKSDRRFADYPENDPLAHLAYMRDAVQRFEGEGFEITVRPEKGGPPSGKDLNVRVVGSQPETVAALAYHMREWIKANQEIAPWLVEFGDNGGNPSRVFRFVPLDRKAALFGATPTDVGLLAASVLDGRYAGKFKASDEEVDLKVKLREGAFDNPEDSLSVPVFQHPTGPVRLGDVCAVRTYEEPGFLNRYEGDRAITLTADIQPGAPISAASVVRVVDEYYQSIRHKFPGATLNFAGAYESTQRSYVSLTYAFLIAIFIMYVILATQFRSYAQPAIILSAVVFSLTGVVFGAFLTQTLFTVNSFVATVGVTGVVVNDSLVLLDFINRSYRSGMSRREAIFEGVRVRIRPILLTTLTTSLGLLPMAIGIPEYSNVWGTMATTFVTGLCTATFLTIFFVPIQWDLLMGAQARIKRWKERRKGRGGDDSV